MEFTVAALQIDERVECVQVDYEPSFNETNEAAALRLDADATNTPEQQRRDDHDADSGAGGAVAERFLLLAEGPFSIRVTSHCDVPAIVRVDIDGVTGRGNYRLTPRGTVVIRAVQLQSGMHPTRLHYRKPSQPTNVKELRDREPDETNDADVTIRTLDASAAINDNGGYATHTSLLMDTMLLRVLFFAVKEVTGMWAPATTSPAAVMALRCGPASRLAVHFGLPMPQNEVLAQQLSREEEELRREEFDAARKREAALVAKLEPWKHKPPPQQQQAPTATEPPRDMPRHSSEDGANHNYNPHYRASIRSVSTGIVEGPGPVAGIDNGLPAPPPAQPPLRQPAAPQPAMCPKCSLHATEKLRFVSELAKWKHEAETWQAKYNAAVNALNREKMAARAGRTSLIEGQQRLAQQQQQQQQGPKAADYYEASSNADSGAEAPQPRTARPRTASATKAAKDDHRASTRVSPALALRRKSPLGPSAEAVQAARKRSLSPKLKQRTVATAAAATSASSDAEPKLTQLARKKSPTPSTRPTRTSSTAPRPNKLLAKPSEKTIAEWGNSTAMWQAPPPQVGLMNHQTRRPVQLTDHRGDEGAHKGVGYVVDAPNSIKAGGGMVLLRQDEVNALLDFAQGAHRFMEHVMSRTTSRESSAARGARGEADEEVDDHEDPLVDVGNSANHHGGGASAPSTVAPPQPTQAPQAHPSPPRNQQPQPQQHIVPTADSRTAQVLQNKRVVSSLLLADDEDDEQHDGRWSNRRQPLHGAPVAHIDYFAMPYDADEVDMPPVLSPLAHR